MRRAVWGSLVTGVLLGVLGLLLVDHGAMLGGQVIHVAEMGVAAGAIVGLVPDRNLPLRAAGFTVGFLASWLGYALEAGVLPDIPMGRAVATLIVILVVTAASAGSLGRLPMWAGLLGIVTFAGGYETTYAASATTFPTDSATFASSAAVAVALGFLLAAVVDGLSGRRPLVPVEEAELTARAPETITLPDAQRPAAVRPRIPQPAKAPLRENPAATPAAPTTSDSGLSLFTQKGEGR